MQSQESVDKDGNKVVVEGKGRHDPCVVPRTVPIVESMAALVIADHLLRNKTAIIVAHRLSTIQDADLIVVLNKGCIVETGRHQELLSLDGQYAQFYRKRQQIEMQEQPEDVH